jgi:hypothetical protein
MTKARGALHLVTADQRRGAEVFAADLVAALEDDASMTHRLAALTAGPSDDGVGATPLGAKPFALSTLRALRGAARDAGAVVAHGSKTLPAGVAALAGLSTPLVYRSIGARGCAAGGPRCCWAGPPGWWRCGRRRPTC